MGQSVARLRDGVEKVDINLDYETYGKEGDADYAVDHNGEYQSSDYDDMEETKASNSIQTKVSILEYQVTS